MSNLDSLRKKTDLELRLPVSYYYQPARNPSHKTVLLLHGYQDSASSFFKRAFANDTEQLEHDYNILAPNGVFPVPVRTNDGFREAYAWYFVDPAKKLVLVSPDIAADNLITLIKYLNLSGHQIQIVGFSQGGILAPFVAAKLQNAAGIIGLGTMFLEDHYRAIKASVPVDAIHGIDDDTITLRTSQTGYDELQSQQPRPGAYYPIANLKHTLDDVARNKLHALIDQRLAIK